MIIGSSGTIDSSKYNTAESHVLLPFCLWGYFHHLKFYCVPLGWTSDIVQSIGFQGNDGKTYGPYGGSGGGGWQFKPSSGHVFLVRESFHLEFNFIGSIYFFGGPFLTEKAK